MICVTLGTRLKDLRKRKNITQSQLAEHLNLTQGAIAQWENGTTNPSIELLPKLASILSCTVDELLGIEKKPIHNE